MGNFLVRYASRVVIYDRRAVIRLATDVVIFDEYFDALKFAVMLHKKEKISYW